MRKNALRACALSLSGVARAVRDPGPLLVGRGPLAAEGLEGPAEEKREAGPSGMRPCAIGITLGPGGLDHSAAAIRSGERVAVCRWRCWGR